MPLIGVPLVIASDRPCAVVKVTRVMTNGGTLSRVTMEPCQKPTAAQITRVSRIASGAGMPCVDVEPGGEDAGEAGQRADGQVDAAGEDDQGLADREDADLGQVAAHHLEVADAGVGRGVDAR